MSNVELDLCRQLNQALREDNVALRKMIQEKNPSQWLPVNLAIEDMPPALYLGKTETSHFCIIIVVKGNFWAYEIVSRLPVKKETIKFIMEISK